MISEDEFWVHMEKCVGRDLAHQHSFLDGWELKKWPEEELLAFDGLMEQYIARLNQPAIRKALSKHDTQLTAREMNAVCRWLIAQGRAFYETVLRYPEAAAFVYPAKGPPPYRKLVFASIEPYRSKFSAAGKKRPKAAAGKKAKAAGKIPWLKQKWRFTPAMHVSEQTVAGDYVVACDAGGAVLVLDRSTGAVVRQWRAHSKVKNTTPCLVRDGQWLCTSAYVTNKENWELKLWDLPSGELLGEIPESVIGRWPPHVAPDGSRVLARMRVYELPSGRLLRSLTKKPVCPKHVTPDVRFAAEGERDVRIWDVERGKVIHTLRGADANWRGAALYLADDEYSISGKWDQTAVHRRGSEQRLFVLPFPLVGRDDATLWGHTKNGYVHCWDHATGELLAAANVGSIDSITLAPPRGLLTFGADGITLYE